MSPFFENWLALDLSGPVGSASIHRYDAEDGSSLIAEKLFGQDQKHAEELIPALIELTQEAEISIQNIHRFLSSRGPGSYTGLRIALATLKAFSLSLDRPLETVDGAEVRAASYCRSVEERNLWVLTRAGWQRFVVSQFANDGEGPILVDQTVRPATWVREQKCPFLLVEDEESLEGITAEGSCVWPLRSKLIGEFAEILSSNEISHSNDELAKLSPDYFGTWGSGK